MDKASLFFDHTQGKFRITADNAWKMQDVLHIRTRMLYNNAVVQGRSDVWNGMEEGSCLRLMKGVAG